MPHIGVEGLRARHGEEDGADHGKSAPGRVGNQCDAVERIQRQQDARVAGDIGDAKEGQDREPHQHDRTEESAYGRRAAILDGKQRDQQPE